MEFEKRFDETIKTISEFKKLIPVIKKVADVMVDAIKSGKKVIVFGNGGSAADAQHFACELSGRFLKNRPALPAIALTTNTSNITAIGNDYSYDEVFSRQLEGIADEGDVVIGISTSGNSKNVIKAIEVANKIGCITIGWTGASGGKLKDIVKYLINVPSTSTPRIQESHVLLLHILSEYIEEFAT